MLGSAVALWLYTGFILTKKPGNLVLARIQNEKLEP
jgi:hypothetical protein